MEIKEIKMIESWNDIATSDGDDPYAQGKSPNDYFEMLDKRDYIEEPIIVRPIGPIGIRRYHTIKTSITTKDTGKTIEKFWTVPCCNYNFDGSYEEHDCPYCKAGYGQRRRYFQNVLVWDLKNTKPDKDERTESEKVLRQWGSISCYFKESKKTSSWTPIRVVEYPQSLVTKFSDMNKSLFMLDKQGNKHLGFSINSLVGGTSIALKYNPKESPANMYSVSRIDDYGRKISKEQLEEWLLWDLYQYKAPDLALVTRNMELNAHRIIEAPNPEFIEEFIKSHPNAIKPKNPTASKPKEKAPIQTVSLDDEEVELPKPNSISKAPQAESYDSSNDDSDDFEDLD